MAEFTWSVLNVNCKKSVKLSNMISRKWSMWLLWQSYFGHWITWRWLMIFTSQRITKGNYYLSHSLHLTCGCYGNLALEISQPYKLKIISHIINTSLHHVYSNMFMLLCLMFYYIYASLPYLLLSLFFGGHDFKCWSLFY